MSSLFAEISDRNAELGLLHAVLYFDHQLIIMELEPGPDVLSGVRFDIERMVLVRIVRVLV